jgi:guanine deaminase
MSSSPTIYYGAVINPETLISYKALPRCLLSVGPLGNIDWIVEDVAEHTLQDTLAQKGCIDVDVTTLRTGEFIVPGFIDTHTVRNICHYTTPRSIHLHRRDSLARPSIP